MGQHNSVYVVCVGGERYARGSIEGVGREGGGGGKACVGSAACEWQALQVCECVGGWGGGTRRVWHSTANVCVCARALCVCVCV